MGQQISLILFFSIFIERGIEYLFDIIEFYTPPIRLSVHIKRLRTRGMALIAGIVLSRVYELSIFPKEKGQYYYVGWFETIIVGLLIAFGSEYIHALISCKARNREEK